MKYAWVCLVFVRRCIRTYIAPVCVSEHSVNLFLVVFCVIRNMRTVAQRESREMRGMMFRADGEYIWRCNVCSPRRRQGSRVLWFRCSSVTCGRVGSWLESLASSQKLNSSEVCLRTFMLAVERRSHTFLSMFERLLGTCSSTYVLFDLIGANYVRHIIRTGVLYFLKNLSFIASWMIEECWRW